MNMPHPSPGDDRKALLVGASGLVGHALLSGLIASPAYSHVHVLARRTSTGIAQAARITLHVVDFAHLPEPLPAVDDVYIALGTTIKTAGSRAAFRAVDFDAVVDTARAARAARASRVAVVSSLGANARSPVFYNRVKGEMQAAIGALGFEVVVFAQPSLLLGDRASIGQSTRPAEILMARTLAPVMWLLPLAVRPIEATKVAASLLAATLDAAPGVRVIVLAQMQG